MQTWALHEQRELVMMVDTALGGQFDAEQACKFLKIGLLCTQDAPKIRPSMSKVVKMLTGEDSVDDKLVTKPGLISDFMDLKVRNDQKAKPFESLTTSCTNSSGYGSEKPHTSTDTSHATMSFTAVYDRSN